MTSLLPGDAIFRSQHHHFWIPRLFLHKNRSRNQFIHDTPIDTKNLQLTPRWAKLNMKIVDFFVAIKKLDFSGFSVFTFSKNIRPPLSGGFYRMKISYCATKCGLLKVRRRFPYKLSSPHLSFNHISKLYFRRKYCSEMARI